jgi:hypothetical protein
MTHLSKLTPGLLTLVGLCFLGTAEAGAPLWTFTPLTNTQITVDSSSTATIQYTVTNQARRSNTLTMTSIPGISQTTTAGNCGNPFTLGYQESCTLTLEVTGRSLTGSVRGGPKVCQQGGGALQCYEPNPSNRLNITLPSAVAVGESYGGGTVACFAVNGRPSLIAATTDNSTGIIWGGSGTATGARNVIDGAANTADIVNCLTNGTGCDTAPPAPLIDISTYAAGICANYAGGGYSDWFLPAISQLDCLYANQDAIGGFTTDASGFYWSSTESPFATGAPLQARGFNFSTGSPLIADKINTYRVRCVRAFTY